MHKQDVIRKIRQIGARGRHYQYRELREALHVNAADRGQTGQLYNIHMSLVNDDIVEELPGERERHKYFRIKDENRLAALAGVAQGENRSAGPAVPVVARIENRLTTLEQTLNDRLEQIEQKVDQLLAAWS